MAIAAREGRAPRRDMSGRHRFARHFQPETRLQMPPAGSRQRESPAVQVLQKPFPSQRRFQESMAERTAEMRRAMKQ